MMARDGSRVPRVLLKARPLPEQLADRLAPPVPDGMELYIHEADVAGEDWLATLTGRLAGAGAPPGFTWIVEGPVWSLDGELFGLCRHGEGGAVDRELTRRLVRLASRLGAVAVNVHCVDGSPDPGVLAEDRRREALERAEPYLRWYVRLCLDAGLVPLIENVPPICRMRRAAYVYTPIGVEPEDLVACVRAAPGLRLTLDTSHAQLAVNAFRGVPPPETGDHDLSLPAAYYKERAGPETLEAFVAPLLPWVESVHVSNAAGLLDEGLPYEEGDADLDGAVGGLAPHARYFVTEPLDPDEDHAVLKRRMQARLTALLRQA
jgi:Xylose isomerase-like TIM barrel